MDIKELDKKQLILLTLLITFIVSIATGIVTVSLMNQMPKSVPQTINNVIQKTIERVTTVPAISLNTEQNINKENTFLVGDGDAIVSIYLKEGDTSVVSTATTIDVNQIGTNTTSTATTNTTSLSNTKELGQGVIVSDIGLVMVDSSILTENKVYKIILNKIDFDATVLKKFANGFTILKISEKKDSTQTLPKTNTTKVTQ